MKKTLIDYKAEVLKVYPTAKCYHTGSILGGSLKVYHIGVRKPDAIEILLPSHMWAGNKNKAFQFVYDNLINTIQPTPAEVK